MNQSLAIFYEADGYSVNNNRLLGRQSAGSGFLKGIIEHSNLSNIYCYTSASPKFANFQTTIQPWNHRQRDFQWITTDNPANLERAGTLYLPGPGLSHHAWARRFANQRAYSICGVTHTIASRNAMNEIGDLLIAPIQPWDALICTSEAVKTSVEILLNDWADYLAQRMGNRPMIHVRLPVIPLGVDCEFFAPKPEARNRLRQALGIPADGFVVLFVGRFCFYAKAHPIPMYLALEQAAKITSTKIYLVQAGWFENDREEAEFRQAPQQFCPSVNSIFVDGRQPDIRSNIWACADIFMSLVDNIQETFGLTPIEAMAAGLPVIISDWNGYKESVRDGIDGFKIPTTICPPGTVPQLNAEYFTEKLNYSTYVANTASVSIVDVSATTAAIVKSIEQPELRVKMGENGRRRAREVYDWQRVIGSYETLWTELAELRHIDAMSAPVKSNKPAHPLCEDPFRLFHHYASQTIDLKTIVTIGSMANPENIAQIRQNWMSNFAAECRLDPIVIDRIIQTVREHRSITVATLLQLYGNYPAPNLIATIANLVKFDLLRFVIGSLP